MTYKIQQIEGIGSQFGDRLAIAGILTSDDLLQKCSTAERRKGVAAHTGLSELQLSTWKNQADLMRISGIGPEYGQWLEASGVRSIRGLSQLSPENVMRLFDRLNTERGTPRAAPPVVTVQKWIDQAKAMRAALSSPTTAHGSTVSESYASLEKTRLYAVPVPPMQRAVAYAK